MAVGSFSLTYPRYLVIDFTTAFYEEPSAILMRAPTLEKQPFALAKPFQSHVWISLLAVMTFISFVLWISSSIKTHQKRYKETNRFDHFFLILYAVLLTQCLYFIHSLHKPCYTYFHYISSWTSIWNCFAFTSHVLVSLFCGVHSRLRRNAHFLLEHSDLETCTFIACRIAIFRFRWNSLARNGLGCIVYGIFGFEFN